VKATIIVWALAIGLPSAALAQPAPAAHEPSPCTAVDAALPPDLVAWRDKASSTAARTAADLPGAVLTVGRAVTATLHPTREVAYVVQPEKPGGSVARGGLFSLPIATAGTYRVVLGSGAWIDLLEGGEPVVSSAHAPGPACTTARKTVEFPLKAGDHVMQISANADATIGILVLARP
jgi:hypothetical protein